MRSVVEAATTRSQLRECKVLNMSAWLTASPECVVERSESAVMSEAFNTTGASGMEAGGDQSPNSVPGAMEENNA